MGESESTADNSQGKSMNMRKQIGEHAACIAGEGHELLSALKTMTNSDIKGYLKTFVELVKSHCDDISKIEQELPENPLPEVSPEQFRKEKIELALRHAPGIVPCNVCGHAMINYGECYFCKENAIVDIVKK
jgi:hypothetical protein